MKKILKGSLSHAANERGNAMMISLIVVFCFIFLAFVFFDVFSTYAYKNASQKATDAAAIAAALEAKDIYEEELAYRLEQAFAPFASGIRDALEEDEGDEDEEEGEVSAQNVGNDDDISEEDLEDNPDLTDAPQVVLDRIIDASTPLTNEALLFFFSDAQITGFICDSMRRDWSRIEEKANYFAQKNGAEDITDLEFPYDGSFEIFASVKTETSFITVPDEAFGQGQRDMHTDASASIPLPEGVSFVLGACH